MLNLPEIVSEAQVVEFFETISYNVKRLRRERGLSQLEVALSIGQKAVGFYASIENYRHGKHFNLLHLSKLSVLFEVEMSEFFKPAPSDLNVGDLDLSDFSVGECGKSSANDLRESNVGDLDSSESSEFNARDSRQNNVDSSPNNADSPTKHDKSNTDS